MQFLQHFLPIGPHVIMLAWFLIPQKTLVILAAIVTIIPWLLYCCTAIKTFTRNLIEYCEISINPWCPNFRRFLGLLKLRKLKYYEIPFSYWLLSVVFETTNSRTHGSMHFVETMNSRSHGSMHFVETWKLVTTNKVLSQYISLTHVFITLSLHNYW